MEANLRHATSSPRDFVATPFVPKGVKAEGCARLFPLSRRRAERSERAQRDRGDGSLSRNAILPRLRRDPLPAEGGVKAEGCARLFPFRAEGQSEANARSATEGMVLCPATPSSRDVVATPSCGRGCESRGLRTSLSPFAPKGVKAEGCARLFPFRAEGV